MYGVRTGEAMSKPTARELLEIIRAGAPDDIDAELARRVEAVLALHKRSEEGEMFCHWCHSLSPCPTVCALDGEEAK